MNIEKLHDKKRKRAEDAAADELYNKIPGVGSNPGLNPTLLPYGTIRNVLNGVKYKLACAIRARDVSVYNGEPNLVYRVWYGTGVDLNATRTYFPDVFTRVGPIFRLPIKRLEDVWVLIPVSARFIGDNPVVGIEFCEPGGDAVLLFKRSSEYHNPYFSNEQVETKVTAMVDDRELPTDVPMLGMEDPVTEHEQLGDVVHRFLNNFITKEEDKRSIPGAVTTAADGNTVLIEERGSGYLEKKVVRGSDSSLIPVTEPYFLPLLDDGGGVGGRDKYQLFWFNYDHWLAWNDPSPRETVLPHHKGSAFVDSDGAIETNMHEYWYIARKIQSRLFEPLLEVAMVIRVDESTFNDRFSKHEDLLPMPRLTPSWDAAMTTLLTEPDGGDISNLLKSILTDAFRRDYNGQMFFEPDEDDIKDVRRSYALLKYDGVHTTDYRRAFDYCTSLPFKRFYALSDSPFNSGYKLLSSPERIQWDSAIYVIFRNSVVGARIFDSVGTKIKDYGIISWPDSNYTLLRNKIYDYEHVLSTLGIPIATPGISKQFEPLIWRAMNDAPMFVYIASNMEIFVFHSLLPTTHCLMIPPEINLESVLLLRNKFMTMQAWFAPAS